MKIFVASSILILVCYCSSSSVRDLKDQYSTIILKQTKRKAKIQGYGPSKEEAQARAEKRAQTIFNFYKLFRKTKCKDANKKFAQGGDTVTCIIYAKKTKATNKEVYKRKEKFNSQFDEYDTY